MDENENYEPVTTEERKRFFTFTSMFSLLRLALLPFIIYEIREYRNGLVFLFMGAVIILDVAARYTYRLRGESSFLGKILDPVVDSLMITTIMVYMSWGEIHIHRHFPWLIVGGVALIIIREWTIIFYSYFIIYRATGAIPRADIFGKLSSASVVLVALTYAMRWTPYNDLLLIISTTFILMSSIRYFWRDLKARFHVKKVSLATKITAFRLLLSPIFLVVFFYDHDMNYTNNHISAQLLAFALCVIFIVTDGLDGYFARKYNEVTKIGKFLDPFSDKISNTTIFLCFLATGFAPVWMVVLIYYREATISVLRTLAAAENIVLSARSSGKFKTGVQGAGILLIMGLQLLLAIMDQRYAGFQPEWLAVLHRAWKHLPYATMGIVTLITVFSGVDYIIASKPVLKKYFT
jgi:CDP-diacylglycerol--glycerol-3-phosphate 3-phosphatidyltransferase